VARLEHFGRVDGDLLSPFTHEISRLGMMIAAE